MKNNYFLDESKKLLIQKLILDSTILLKINVEENLLSLHIIFFIVLMVLCIEKYNKNIKYIPVNASSKVIEQYIRKCNKT